MTKQTNTARPLVNPQPKYLTMKEVVTILGITEQTVRKLADADVIESVRDENNYRLFEPNSVALYLMHMRLHRDRRAYIEGQKRIGEAIGRARRVKS